MGEISVLLPIAFPDEDYCSSLHQSTGGASHLMWNVSDQPNNFVTLRQSVDTLIANKLEIVDV